MESRKVREQVSIFSKLIHEKGWVANHDGNVSGRVRDRFWITPTGVSKRLCEPGDIVECEMGGQSVGRGRAPSEVALHVGAYRSARPVNAVIHAHPPNVSAFALAQRPLGVIAMPEVVVSLGREVPLIPLFMPKDEAVSACVAKALGGSDALLLSGNGALTVGPDLETAFLRMELLEHYAEILRLALTGLGAPVELRAEQMGALLELRRKAGLVTPAAAELGSEGAPRELREVISEEIRRVLGGE